MKWGVASASMPVSNIFSQRKEISIRLFTSPTATNFSCELRQAYWNMMSENHHLTRDLSKVLDADDDNQNCSFRMYRNGLSRIHLSTMQFYSNAWRNRWCKAIIQQISTIDASYPNKISHEHIEHGAAWLVLYQQIICRLQGTIEIIKDTPHFLDLRGVIALSSDGWRR